MLLSHSSNPADCYETAKHVCMLGTPQAACPAGPDCVVLTGPCRHDLHLQQGC